MMVTEHFERMLKSTQEPRYKVIRVFRDCRKHEVLEENLTLQQAQKIVRTFPDKEETMVLYIKQ